VYALFTRKLPLTSKVDVEDGKGIDTNIRKGQDHYTRESLSISRVQSNSRNDLGTHGDMDVLFTYVTHPCDSQELDTQLVGYTTIDVKVILLCLIVKLNPIYDKGRLSWQSRPNQLQDFVVNDILAPPPKNRLPLICNLNPNIKQIN
jgi:hypothetical protein